MATNKKIKDAIALLKMEGYHPLEDNQVRCQICGKYKSTYQLNFYQSTSPLHKGNTAKHKYMPKNSKESVVEERAWAPVCKKCVEVHIGDASIDRVLTVLQMLDKPFIKDTWDDTWDRHAHKAKPITILGHYMKNIALNHKDKFFKDSDDPTTGNSKTDDTRDEERKYNKQWMGSYTKSEITYLNDYLKTLKEDFNIITKNHTDYAKKIAKASLVMDKEYEKIIEGAGNVADYDKYKKIFDDLSKSAQFAESGRGKSAVSNGIAEIVETVENHQWVYKKDDYEKDDIDLLLNQFGNINKSL